VSGNDSEIQSIAGTEPVAGGPIPAKDFSWIDALIGEDLYDGLSTREFLDLCELELFKGEANWSREDRRRHREIWAKIFATNEILRGLPSLLEWPEDDAE
jgi:hypothetical protein